MPVPLSPQIRTLAVVGATLARNWYLLHARAFADHVAFETVGGAQPLVLAFEPFQMTGVLQGDRTDPGDGRQYLQVIFVKRCGRVARVQVDDAELSLMKH